MRSAADRQQYVFERTLPVASGCWLWSLPGRDKDGYGSGKLDGKSVRAHRLAYAAFVGEVPDELMVCHECDVPDCCNPDHLFLGTAKVNAEDRNTKGRQCKGEKSRAWARASGTQNGRSTIPDVLVDKVKELRGQGLLLREVKALTGVSVPQISKIYRQEIRKAAK